MRGKDINITVTAGREAERTIRVYREDGERWEVKDVGVEGRVWDMRMEEEKGEIECRVTGEGEIELKYPALGAGRYVFAVDGVSEDGERERVIEGYIGYEEPRYEGFEDDGEVMLVVLGGEKRKVLFGRNRAWEGKYEETEKARIAAVEASESALEALAGAQAFIESFNEAVSKAVRVDAGGVLVIGDYWTGVKVKGEDGESPRIGSNGHWWIGGADLGVPAQGERGLSASIGSDGNWYIGGENTGVQARGRDGIDGTSVRRILVDAYEDIPQEGDTCHGGYYYYVALGGTRTVATGWVRVGNGGVFKVAGIEISCASAEDAVNKLAAVEHLTDVYAEVDVHDAGLVRLTALEAGVAGNRITLETNDARVELSGTHLEGGRVLNPTSWEMYSWLEGQGDVKGEWVKVDEPSDIATTRTYGFTKLGTDVDVEGGAPVGKDANGRMSVPAASESVAGTGKLSGSEGLVDGGYVGMDIYGAFRVELGGYAKYGAVSLSYSGVAEVPCVGQMNTGAVGLRWAGAGNGGAVIMAEGITDVRSYAVLSASEVKKYLDNNYHLAAETWTREETAAYIEWLLKSYYTKTETLNSEEVDRRIQLALAGYDDAESTELAIRELAGQIADEKLESYYAKSESDERYIQSGEGQVKKVHVMSKSAFDKLANREGGAIYFVTRDKA